MNCIGKCTCTLYHKASTILIFRHTLTFVYGHILEKELNEFVVSWNSHWMRKNKHTMCLLGVPDDIFFLSENSEIVSK